MTSTTNPQTNAVLGPEEKVDPTHFQRAPILDPVLQETYTAHLEKRSPWMAWMDSSTS